MSKMTRTFETNHLPSWKAFLHIVGPEKARQRIDSRSRACRMQKLFWTSAGLVALGSAFHFNALAAKGASGALAIAGLAAAYSNRREEQNFIAMRNLPEFAGSPAKLPVVAPMATSKGLGF